jgi:hypothetical protein
MKIDLDDYVVEYSEKHWTVYKKKQREKGKHVGEDYLAVVGYYPNSRYMLHGVAMDKLSEVVYTTVKEVEDIVNSFAESVSKKLTVEGKQ